jgi:FKBP-type peptidyl-prolyl cis-trans isomerase FkpA
MTKNAIVRLLVLGLAPLLCAQTPAHRPTHPVRPNTNAPTKVGTGEVAKDGSHVKVHYTGWLTTGKKFDSSVDAHQPFDFAIGKGDVIKGWDEGVTGMKVGGKRQLRIPPELAYGAEGHPPQIPHNATLIFDVQLLAVK